MSNVNQQDEKDRRDDATVLEFEAVEARRGASGYDLSWRRSDEGHGGVNHGEEGDTLPKQGARYLVEAHPRILKRFQVAVTLAQVAFFLSALNAAWFFYNNYTLLSERGSVFFEIVNVICMVLVVLGIFVSRVLVSKGKLVSAVRMAFAAITGGLLLITYINGGFAQAALLGFSIIVVVSAFFGNRQLGAAVTISFALGVLVMYLIGVAGISPPALYRENNVVEVFFHLHEAIYVWVILLASHLIASIMVDDFKNLMEDLEHENHKVRAFSHHLKTLNMQDPLTHLHNRVYGERYFSQLADEVSTSSAEYEVTMCFLDLDNFKHINTKFGHLGGDEVIIKVANRLQSLAGENDCELARIGGDEFILWKICEREQVPLLLERFLAKISKPVPVGNTAVTVSASIGVTERSGETASFWELVREADIAMREAKHLGGARYAYFQIASGEQMVREFDLLTALQTAHARQDFHLLYQPQVELPSGQVMFAEALLRWTQEDGKVVSPKDFIPVAERSDLIVEMTEWALKRAGEDCQVWRREGNEVGVSVNISPKVFDQADVAEMVGKALEATGLPPDYMELELTESLMMRESNRVKEQFGKLSRLGVSLAVDDFGVGYSNLGALVWARFDKLKIDRRFITDLHFSKPSQDIVKAIVQMAKAFGMQVVAEGVENESEAHMARLLGCDLGQGFLWSRAATLSAFMEDMQARVR